MNTTQIQLKISLSQQLNDLLMSKAARFGVPVTQFVKYLILKEVEEETYPTFQMSEQTEQRLEEAMKHVDEAIEIDNIDEFFKKL